MAKLKGEKNKLLLLGLKIPFIYNQGLKDYRSIGYMERTLYCHDGSVGGCRNKLIL